MPTAKISTTTLNYIERGSGPPVLLLHGFPLDHTMWAPQIDTLSARARVIAPDLRGFGESPLAPGDEAAGVAMERYADDVAELLDALAINEPVVLVGFSMGGYIAWQFARKYPERLRALVPCDTLATADSDEIRDGRLKMAGRVAEWGSGRVAELMELKLFAPQSLEGSLPVVAELRAVMGRQSPAAIAAAQRGMAARPDMSGFLPQIRVPTLVVVGEHDAISSPTQMESIAAAIPGAKCVVIPDAGHMTTLENPAAVNEALARFL